MSFFNAIGNVFKGITKTPLAKMTPAQWGPLALGLISSFGGANRGNRQANALDAEAIQMQRAAAAQAAAANAAQMDLFNRMRDIAIGAMDRGVYDPAKARERIMADMQAGIQQGTRAIAQNSRLLGYRQGDTVPTQNMNALVGNYSRRMSNQLEQYRLNQPSAEMGLFSRLVPVIGNIAGFNSASAANTARFNQVTAANLRQRNDVSPLAALLMQFLQEEETGNARESGTQAPRAPQAPATGQADNAIMPSTVAGSTMAQWLRRNFGSEMLRRTGGIAPQYG